MGVCCCFVCSKIQGSADIVMFYSGSHHLLWDMNHLGPFENVLLVGKGDGAQG